MTTPDLFAQHDAISTLPFTAKAPVFWFKRFAFLRTLSPDRSAVVRSVSFHRGLNVVWARPIGHDAAQATGVRGHAAGKTALCRLLRYCLGEKGFANEWVAAAISNEFPEAVAAAEVVVEGQLWSVFRPVGMGAPAAFTVAGAEIDHVLRTEEDRLPVKRFDDGLHRVLQESLTVKTLPNGTSIRTAHILPWLTRDQEARLFHLVDWRDPAVNSEAPKTSREDRHLIVRSLIGAVSDREVALMQKQDRLSAEMRDAKVELDYTRRALAGEEKALRASMQTLANDERPLPLAADTLRKKTEADRDAVSSAFDEEPQGLADAREAWVAADAARSTAESNLHEMEGALDERRAAVDKYEGKLLGQQKKEDELDRRASLHPRRKFCATPIDVARQSGCPCLTENPPDATSFQALFAYSEDGLEHQRQLLAQTELAVAFERQGVEAARKEAGYRKAIYSRANRAYRRSLARKAQSLGVAETRLQRLSVYAQAVEDVAKAKRALVAKEKEHRKCTDQLASVRTHSRRSLASMQGSFDVVIRELLGDAVSTELQSNGVAIEPMVYDRGQLTSGAIDVLKCVGFDIAALLASLQGHGRHPRFLIHDSPREADLDPATYRELFALMREMERPASPNGEHGFQYIVTTTEPPPDDMQRDPWLVLELDASRAEGRLLKVDLGAK